MRKHRQLQFSKETLRVLSLDEKTFVAGAREGGHVNAKPTENKETKGEACWTLLMLTCTEIP